MVRSLRLQVVIAVSMAFAVVLVTPGAAQWLDYLIPGIPRLPDGRPNLTAPTPRTADGKPNLSGIWHVENGSQNEGGEFSTGTLGKFHPALTDLTV
jgi:hypothetical protein